MNRGKIVWAVCFFVLLLSSPLLIVDLVGIQRSVELASGADFWYDGQIYGDLLRLKVALRGLGPSPDPAAADEVRLRLDNAFTRLNSLPEPTSNAWHTQGIVNQSEFPGIRARLEAIDRLAEGLDTDPAGFRRAAEVEIDEAITLQRKSSLAVMDRQNALIGHMQMQVGSFQMKLLAYGVGSLAVILGLGWLMRRHMRSEADLLATNRQLTEATQRLEVARDQALLSSRAKSNFLANVSHELRTPLNAIMGFSEVLGSGLFGPLSPRQAEYIGDIHSSGERLLALINDILDISKLEAGKLELHEEIVDPVKLAGACIHDLREITRRAGLSIGLEAKATVPCVLADRLRLRQVIDNLLSNSIKFTPPNGSIRVAVSAEPDGRILIQVVDTGIGIAPRDLQRVFKPFEQINSQLARKHQGAGLGLPLVKQFVEWHGGTIAIESRPSGGTCVTLTLPADRTVTATVEA